MSLNQRDNLKQYFQQAHKSQRGLFLLLEIGRNQGFYNFINRRLIWPFLLAINEEKLKNRDIYSWKIDKQARDQQYLEIQKDTERAVYCLKTFQSCSKFYIKKKQQAILSVLNSIFKKNADLNYVQGFHDVASVLLIMCDDDLAYYLSEKMARVYFYDFLTFPTHQITQIASQIILEIAIASNISFKKIFSYFEEKKILIFILPWIMTWFSHNISSMKTIARLWDYLLCTGPHGILYFVSALMLQTSAQLIASCKQYNQAQILVFYQQLFKKQDVDIQKIIRASIQLQLKIDITQLVSYQKLNEKSMYRTENFIKQLPIHANNRENRKIKGKGQRKLSTALIVGGTLLLLGTAVFLRNKIKLNQIKEM